MVQIKLPKRINWRNKPLQALHIKDFQNLQATQKDGDKMVFKSFAIAQNVIYKKGNATTRQGTKSITNLADCLGLHLHKTTLGTTLYGFIKNVANTDIVEIDKTLGTQTVKASITGANLVQYSSLGGHLFLANSTTNLYDYNPNDDSVTNVSVLGSTVKLITNDGVRLWAVGEETNRDTVYFSDAVRGINPNFNTGGTLITRSGVANTEIAEIIQIQGAGRGVVVFGRNTIEGHATPDFSANALTQYDQGIETKKWSIEGYGIESSQALAVVKNYIYFKPTGRSFLVKLNALTGELTELSIDSSTIEGLDHTNGDMVFDSTRELLYYSCKKDVTQDTTVVYNLRENNFAQFTGIYPEKWTGDDTDIFFKSAISDKLIRAFDSTQFTDDGELLKIKLQTNTTDNGLVHLYKKAVKAFLGVRAWSDTDISFNFYADKSLEGDHTPNAILKFAFVAETLPSADMLSVFSFAPLGLAGFDPNSPANNVEAQSQNQWLLAKYQRAYCEVVFETNSRVDIRGLGFFWEATDQQAKILTALE